MSSELRRIRQAAGLSQVELAARAGVSRQLISAAEAGRHVPRVDAALALAAALGVGVADLFDRPSGPVDAVSGLLPPDAAVRTGRVGRRVVTAPARVDRDGWDAADAIVEDGHLVPLGTARPGLVAAGCEPGLEVLERLLREAGMGAVTAPASTASALAALEAGRLHAAAVHGPTGSLRARPSIDVERHRIARWQVGLAAPAGARDGWWEAVLAGRAPVVQREQGAGVQRALEEAAGAAPGSLAGPRVATHLEAARRAVLTGMAAVTIEPAARAVGAEFHPLETHEAELWVAAEWSRDRVVTEALDLLSGRRFQRRLASVGGYDLADCGTRVA